MVDSTERLQLGVCAFAALLASACSSPRARPSDAAIEDAPTPTADASLCGNQVVDRREECDEGLRNGTPDGRCTKQCVLGIYPNSAILLATQLPGHKIHDVVDVELRGNDHVAFRDDDAIYLALGLNAGTLGHYTPQQLVSMRGAAPPTSLGWFKMRDPFQSDPGALSFPIWLEQPSQQTGGAQGLYWAHLDANNQPVIHPIPYPFADGTGGVLLTPHDKWPIIVDQSSTPPYDLLVAVVLPRGENDVGVTSGRIPARGMKRGVVAGNRYQYDLVEIAEANPPPPVQRILQFYSDTHSFSQIDLRPPSAGDYWGAPFSIVESGSGLWPFDVATAVDWREAIVDGPDVPGFEGLTHPDPFAVINSDGSVYMWQFNTSFDSTENVVTPFAQVPPGTRIACMFEHVAEVSVLWALAPDGRVFILNDADSTTVTSSSLEPEVLPAFAPWANAAVSPAFGDSYPLMGVDDTIYEAVGS